VSAPVLLFSVSLCILTGVIFGIGPALQSSRKVIQSALQEGAEAPRKEAIEPGFDPRW